MATKKTTSAKTVNFGKASPNKKMLGNAKSPHKAPGFKKGKKLKESAAPTFKEKRQALLVTMLEAMIDGDDSSSSRMLKEYLSLKSHQIIMEKDDDDEIGDDESNLDSAKSKLDDLDDEDSDSDDDSDDMDDEDSDEDDDSKIFKTKKTVGESFKRKR